MRTSYVQDRETGELIPAAEYHRAKVRVHHVMPDLPDYQSPIDGSHVHGRAGRREDLRRNQCRPYEGRAAEEKEAARVRGYDEARSDANLDRAVRTAYAQLTPQQRRELTRT